MIADEVVRLEQIRKMVTDLVTRSDLKSCKIEISWSVKVLDDEDVLVPVVNIQWEKINATCND